jgi:hypothetical protein
MLIDCIIKNKTKAGIRCEIDMFGELESSPVIIFLAKEHNYKIELYDRVQEEESIQISVIGQRYELNDPFISILGKLKGYSRIKAKKYI